MAVTSDILLKKKKFAIDFRRFITFQGSGQHVRDYLGADIGAVREWIQSCWQPDMTWQNYGSLWVIDHIVPLRIFDPNNPGDLRICWHYKNLMPLYKADNLKKEGNVFYAFLLFNNLKDKDFFFQQLYDRIRPEVEWIMRYIETFHQKYQAGRAQIHNLKPLTKAV